ncbi:hypothetical protein ACNF40_04520 [Cuniculiplasma sp. SKW4]|uniref:hypothetical protein n=1 Tax=Cuniculiplasma sp. SKW4 TaxID=3400171 RepID=UPI003FD02FD3
MDNTPSDTSVEMKMVRKQITLTNSPDWYDFSFLSMKSDIDLTALNLSLQLYGIDIRNIEKRFDGKLFSP